MFPIASKIDALLRLVASLSRRMRRCPACGGRGTVAISSELRQWYCVECLEGGGL